MNRLISFDKGIRRKFFLQNSPFRCKLPPHDPLIARIKTKGLSRRQQLDMDLMAQEGVVSGPFLHMQ